MPPLAVMVPKPETDRALVPIPEMPPMSKPLPSANVTLPPLVTVTAEKSLVFSFNVMSLPRPAAKVAGPATESGAFWVMVPEVVTLSAPLIRLDSNASALTSTSVTSLPEVIFTVEKSLLGSLSVMSFLDPASNSAAKATSSFPT